MLSSFKLPNVHHHQRLKNKQIFCRHFQVNEISGIFISFLPHRQKHTGYLILKKTVQR